MLEHHPGNALMDAAAVQIGHRIDQFSPQDTTNAIGAYAKLFHSPPAELVQVGSFIACSNKFDPGGGGWCVCGGGGLGGVSMYHLPQPDLCTIVPGCVPTCI